MRSQNKGFICRGDFQKYSIALGSDCRCYNPLYYLGSLHEVLHLNKTRLLVTEKDPYQDPYGPNTASILNLFTGGWIHLSPWAPKSLAKNLLGILILRTYLVRFGYGKGVHF